MGRPYLDLAAILRDKDYFILTTNVDTQCERTFPPERVCRYQGDLGYVQCFQPCHDAIYRNEELVKALDEARNGGFALPKELVPRCRQCGRMMVPWVRDDTFLEGSV